MKKLSLLLLLLFVVKVTAQEHVPDPVSNEMLKYLKSVDVDSYQVRDYLKQKIGEIISSTNDTIVSNSAKKYIKSIESIKLIEPKKIGEIALTKEQKKEFKLSGDKFKGTTYIEHKGSAGYPIELYIVAKDNNASLRMVTLYSGSEWVFMKNIILLIDGKKYTYSIGDADRKVHSGSSLTERDDQSVKPNTLEIIRALVNTKAEVDLRFEGDRSVRDKVLSQKVIEKIRETYELYNSLQ